MQKEVDAIDKHCNLSIQTKILLLNKVLTKVPLTANKIINAVPTVGISV